MKNVLEYDIKTSTTQKGYMHGFQGFANVVKKINLKLSKKISDSDFDSWAVDVDYNSTIPIRDQINNKVVHAIKRIQGPVLNLMRLFGMQEISSYCGNIDSINDICSIYLTASRPKNIILGNLKLPDENLIRDEEEMMKRLTNLALDFNAGNGSCNNDNIVPINVSTIVVDVMKPGETNEEEFNSHSFFKFISHDISNNNIGHMLHYMSESMNTTFEKNKVQGSISSLQKVQSLKGRWFTVTKENVEELNTGNCVERNCIYKKDGKFYRVLSIFKKSYNKWRHERQGKPTDKMKVHLQVLEEYFFGYHAHVNFHYICEDSTNLGTYLGHALGINK